MDKNWVTNILRRSLPGAFAGVAATAAMSAVLGIADGFGIMARQPPCIIVADLFPRLTKTEKTSAALISHLGYGAAAGAGYTMVTAPKSRNALSGTTYGIAVWAAGYEGWLPLLGILPPAHKDARGRAVTMLVAHIVYGATLGQVAALQHRRAGRSHRARRFGAKDAAH